MGADDSFEALDPASGRKRFRSETDDQEGYDQYDFLGQSDVASDMPSATGGEPRRLVLSLSKKSSNDLAGDGAMDSGRAAAAGGAPKRPGRPPGSVKKHKPAHETDYDAGAGDLSSLQRSGSALNLSISAASLSQLSGNSNSNARPENKDAPAPKFKLTLKT